jgi:Polyphosphate kinase N-terminal domain
VTTALHLFKPILSGDIICMPKTHTPEQCRERYLNRELSSVAFNYRVLEEANNPDNPLLMDMHAIMFIHSVNINCGKARDLLMFDLVIV